MSSEVSDVEALVHEKYPRVLLESRVQGWAYLEEFERGIAAYEEIEQPTPQDDRWVGVCYFQKFDDGKALEAFYRAVQRGEEGARVNLAHLLRFLERADEAAKEFGMIAAERLNFYDQVLLHRVRSLHEENNGNLREALSSAEEAWRRTQGLPEFELLAPSILAQLGTLHGRIGRAQRALWFLERGIQITKGLEQFKVRTRWASVLVALGRFREAQAEVGGWELENYPPAFSVLKELLLGEIAWSTGDVGSSKRRYLEVLELSRTHQTVYEEFLARLALVALAGVGGAYAEASAHLARAQMLINDKSDRLAYRFREILLLSWQGDSAAAEALAELQVVAEEFGDMGLLQEHGWVLLHIANLKLRLGDGSFREELDLLQALSISLQNSSFLAREWVLVPGLRTVARESHPEIAGPPPQKLEVVTLGLERLTLNGRPVGLPLQRGVEMLAYLLEHGVVNLGELVADIFPGERYRSAKAAFHRFRHQLRTQVPGLEIAFDAEARRYRLKSEIDIVWDLAELRAGRFEGEPGLFLPSSANAWALRIDRAIDPLRSAPVEGA